MTTDGDYDYYVWNLPVNGIQNGSPDGVALSQNGTLIEFLSYEGPFAATNGSAAGTTSTDIGVAETGSETAGLSLQRVGDGPTQWVGPQAQTPGADNEGGGGGGDPTAYLISEIQGSGTASFRVGEYVLVSAVVTYTVGDGFFLQEEDGDADGNSATSEGIFVFTGGAPGVSGRRPCRGRRVRRRILRPHRDHRRHRHRHLVFRQHAADLGRGRPLAGLRGQSRAV